MKFLALLSVVFGAQSALAGGPGEPVLTKHTSAGARPPQYRHSRTVEVYPMGGVSVTTIDGKKTKTSMKEPLSGEVMMKIKSCAAKVRKAKEVKSPTCAGSGGTRYYVGEKMVSVRTCGEENTMSISCVDSVIKLLDRY